MPIGLPQSGNLQIFNCTAFFSFEREFLQAALVRRPASLCALQQSTFWLIYLAYRLVWIDLRVMQRMNNMHSFPTLILLTTTFLAPLSFRVCGLSLVKISNCSYDRYHGINDTEHSGGHWLMGWRMSTTKLSQNYLAARIRKRTQQDPVDLHGLATMNHGMVMGSDFDKTRQGAACMICNETRPTQLC